MRIFPTHILLALTLLCGPAMAQDFTWIAQELRKLNKPQVNLLEGGYSNDLPKLIFAYLKGLLK